MKKVLSIVLGSILTIGIVACVSGENTSTDTVKVETKQETKQETKKVKNEEPKEEEVKEETKNKILQVGESIEANGYRFTLNSAEVYQSTNEFMMPKEGFEFFKANLTVENITNEEKNMSTMLMLNMIDDAGVSYDMAFAETEGSLDGTIGAGRKMTGDYTCEVKTNVPLELEIKPEPFQNGLIIFKLR